MFAVNKLLDSLGYTDWAISLVHLKNSIDLELDLTNRYNSFHIKSYTNATCFIEATTSLRKVIDQQTFTKHLF